MRWRGRTRRGKGTILLTFREGLLVALLSAPTTTLVAAPRQSSGNTLDSAHALPDCGGVGCRNRNASDVSSGLPPFSAYQ